MYGNGYGYYAQNPYQMPSMQQAVNPYQARLNTMQGANMPQQMSIVRVNGENGARAFQMAPNSECLLLDANNPIVWLCQADGAGYKTVTPFNIAPAEQQKQQEYKSLEDRIKRLEDRLNEQSDFRHAPSADAGTAYTATGRHDGYVPAVSAVPSADAGKKPRTDGQSIAPEWANERPTV